jgi:hypothetical protein
MKDEHYKDTPESTSVAPESIAPGDVDDQNVQGESFPLLLVAPLLNRHRNGLLSPGQA